MYVRSLLFIAMFQYTMAVWNPNTSLYLVDLPTRQKKFTKIFPLEIPSKIKQPEIYRNAIYFSFCPNPLAGNENCNYGNLRGASTTTSGQLSQICSNPVVYTAVPDFDNQTLQQNPCFQLNSLKRGYIYHFVYLLCQIGEIEPTEGKIIYKVCYRADEKETIYASAIIEKPSLLGNASLQDERNYPFAFDDTHYHNPYTQDIINASIFLYDPVRTSNYTPEFVLPPVLFPFAHQRTTIYHHMNLAPMESALTEGRKVCLNKLVDKLSTYNLTLNVYAGLLGVLKDAEGNDLYLGEYNGKKEIPIPSIFWLMLVSESHYQGVAIIMHNRNYSTVEIQPNQLFHEEDCNAQVCRDADLEDILPPSQSPVHIVCCFPNALNFYFDLDVRNTLLKLS